MFSELHFGVDNGRAKTVYCHCAYTNLVPDADKNQLLKGLSESGLAFEVVPDLCQLAAAKDEKLLRWAGCENLNIIACFDRAVRWLFHMAGVKLNHDNVRIFNARTQKPESIITALAADKCVQKSSSQIDIHKQGNWLPWFPVIDYDRCKNCKQCLNFCLFGVYSLSDEQTVRVTRPENCKTNCPACARICPHTAIIFPKYNQSPINGDVVDDETVEEVTQKVNLAELLGGDIYENIRKRSASREGFSDKQAVLNEKENNSSNKI
ncbi:MAG: ferredoxin family protein [Planctomycetota bacterium]